MHLTLWHLVGSRKRVSFSAGGAGGGNVCKGCGRERHRLRKLNGGEFVSSVDGAGSERKRQDVAKTLDLTLRSTGNYRQR